MIEDYSVDYSPTIKINVSKESSVYSIIVDLHTRIEAVVVNKRYTINTPNELAIMLNELTLQQANYFFHAIIATREHRFIFKKIDEFITIMKLLEPDKRNLIFCTDNVMIVHYLIKTVKDSRLRHHFI